LYNVGDNLLALPLEPKLEQQAALSAARGIFLAAYL
jgi:hypothetical protein